VFSTFKSKYCFLFERRQQGHPVYVMNNNTAYCIRVVHILYVDKLALCRITVRCKNSSTSSLGRIESICIIPNSFVKGKVFIDTYTLLPRTCARVSILVLLLWYIYYYYYYYTRTFGAMHHIDDARLDEHMSHSSSGFSMYPCTSKQIILFTAVNCIQNEIGEMRLWSENHWKSKPIISFRAALNRCIY
jgi:hypothetical protein